jgi:hypothetical protein
MNLMKLKKLFVDLLMNMQQLKGKITLNGERMMTRVKKVITE